MSSESISVSSSEYLKYVVMGEELIVICVDDVKEVVKKGTHLFIYTLCWDKNQTMITKELCVDLCDKTVVKHGSGQRDKTFRKL